MAILSGAAWRWTLAVLAITAVPALFGFALSLLPLNKGVFSLHWWRAVAREVSQALAQLLFRLAFLCHQGFVPMDAAVRAMAAANSLDYADYGRYDSRGCNETS